MVMVMVMVKTLAFLCILLLLGGVVETARADCIEFSEIFLGTAHDADFFSLERGWRGEFQFDLTAAGNPAKLYNQNGEELVSVQAGIDEAGYNMSLYNPPCEGELSFVFSDNDPQRELITIYTGLYDGSDLVYSMVYNLGRKGGARQYAPLRIDLASEGLLDYLADGQFASFVICPIIPGIEDNDIRIDQAALTVSATPVPIPSACLLFFSGLIGLAGIRRKFA
ncbi:MAG: hypothetical protein AB1611_11635 [bacterium]